MVNDTKFGNGYYIFYPNRITDLKLFKEDYLGNLLFPTTDMISSQSFFWTFGYLHKYQSVYKMVFDVVSDPAAKRFERMLMKFNFPRFP